MRHTGLTSKRSSQEQARALEGKEGIEGERCWKAGCHAAVQKSTTIWVQWSDYTCRCSHIYNKVDGENRKCWLPWSLLVSVLTSPVSFVLKHVRNVTSTAFGVLPPPSPALSSLQCHISIPHALHSRLRNAGLAKAPAPGAQFTMAGEKLSGPKSQRKTAELNAALSLLLHFVWSVQLFQCLHTQQCNNLHPCAFFHVAYWDLSQLCLLLVKANPERRSLMLMTNTALCTLWDYIFVCTFF